MFLTNDVQDASESSRWHPAMDARRRRGQNRGHLVRVHGHSPTIRKDADTSDVNRSGNRYFHRLWMELEHRHGRRPAA